MKTSTVEVGELVSTLSAAGIHRQLSTLPGEDSQWLVMLKRTRLAGIKRAGPPGPPSTATKLAAGASA